jgi:hypothetical protein
MKNFKFISSIVLATTLTAGMTTAYACDLNSGGFLAAVVECAAPSAGPAVRTLDRLNGQMGNPVDHAIANGMNAVAPGSGTALEAGWAIQRSGVFNQPQQPQFQQQGVPQQTNGRPTRQVSFQAQNNMGNFCSTPAGRFGPGPVDYLGNNCWAHSTYGVVYGFVSR